MLSSLIIVLALTVFSTAALAGYWPSGSNYCKIVYVQQNSNGEIVVRYTYNSNFWVNAVNLSLSESIQKNILATLLTAAAQNSNVQMDFVGGKIQGVRIFAQ